MSRTDCATTSAENSSRAKPRDSSSLGRILIVEDDFLVAMQLENDLRDAGYEILGPAGTAGVAIDLAQRERPDLVVMDIRLIGDRDGVDAALEIFRSTGIRSIFATAHSDPRHKARAMAASPLGWIQKPYSRASVLSEIANALRSVQRTN